MQEALSIGLAPEALDEGSSEERAAFGLFTIRSAHCSLTEGFDSYIEGLRPGPLASGYHAAEWFAWNWWRLRYEPRSDAGDWGFAHRMTSIGEGYVWPNLTIFSDGLRTALISAASSRPDAKPFRYLGAHPVVVPSATFEAAVDAFIPRILGRLREQGVAWSNLDRVWSDVLAERRDPEIARRRRLEALLGRDAEEAATCDIEALIADQAQLGTSAVEEVAAEAARGRAILTFTRLREVARGRGLEASPRDAVRVEAAASIAASSDKPAWRIGAEAARALRAQEHWEEEPISNDVLAKAIGASHTTVLESAAGDAPISFMLSEDAGTARIVLRSRHPTGRRFDLARLLGDRIMEPAGALNPATRAYTYRQKAQRSFAAELLAPFAAVDDMLGGDYSPEAQQEAAEHFDVSPMVIDTLLKNHGRIERGVQD